MRRPLRLVFGLMLVLLLVCVGAFLFIDSLATQAVERGGTHALGVETRLDDASIGLLSGRFGLQGLTVANPPGYERPEFLELRSASLEVPATHLLARRVRIPALELEGITLDLERNDKGTNYRQILDNLGRFESGGGEPGDEAPAEDAKTYHVERLVIRDVRAIVQLFPAGGAATKLDFAVPEIVVEDLASDMTLAQVCALVVKVVIRAAVQAGEGVVPNELLADLRGRLEDLKGTTRERLDAELGKLEDGLREQARKLGPEAEKALQEASDGLGGLFDKKKKKD